MQKVFPGLDAPFPLKSDSTNFKILKTIYKHSEETKMLILDVSRYPTVLKNKIFLNLL